MHSPDRGSGEHRANSELHQCRDIGAVVDFVGRHLVPGSMACQKRNRLAPNASQSRAGIAVARGDSGDFGCGVEGKFAHTGASDDSCRVRLHKTKIAMPRFGVFGTSRQRGSRLRDIASYNIISTPGNRHHGAYFRNVNSAPFATA